MKILPKIDIHVHAVPEVLIRRPRGDGFPTPSELREMYADLGIEKGVLLPDGVYPEGTDDITSPREARNMVRDFPDVFGWWFAPISPRMASNATDCDLSYYLKQYKALGARGVGEIQENLPFDDPYMMNLWKHCEACNMPVIFHIGNRGNDYGVVDELGLPRLEKVLKAFPQLKVLGHSQKFWAEIGQTDEQERNGYPTGKVIPGRLVELFRKYPNLYGDLSAGSGANAMMRDPAFSYPFMEEFQDRLFFGTDICSPLQRGISTLRLAGFLDEAMQNGKISYATYEKISRGNALNLLEG